MALLTPISSALHEALQARPAFCEQLAAMQASLGMKPCPMDAKHTPEEKVTCDNMRLQSRIVVTAAVVLLAEVKAKVEVVHPRHLAGGLVTVIHGLAEGPLPVPDAVRWQYEELIKLCTELVKLEGPSVEDQLKARQKAALHAVMTHPVHQAETALLTSRLTQANIKIALLAARSTEQKGGVYHLTYASATALSLALLGLSQADDKRLMVVPIDAFDPAMVATYIPAETRFMVAVNYILELSDLDPSLQDVVIGCGEYIIDL